ncbi:immune inhibitor A domain-containing protein [Aquibacillus kalidii]|uniref:immune inhibitor A domain-containing protein n=1 Tax=Aquibacillus kalidii TaxID=2762597 RepID=UPI001643FCEF|nr:immune inhibitor A domain-containing protein [Aquibacillus kalidii]
MVNWKKIMGTSALSAGLVFSSFAPMFTNVQTVEAKSTINVQSSTEENLPFLGQHVSGPFDLGMVNKEKVLASLIKQGVIDANASREVQEKKLGEYLQKRAKGAEALASDQMDQKQVRTDIQKAAGLDQVPAVAPKASESELAKASSSEPDKIMEEGWDGPVQTDKILVLLIEFPDLATGEITAEDDPVLLYDNYTKEHYEEMVFGEESYKGPDGQDLISMREYYEQQSGGSYSIDGAVSDWYTAEHPASYYGGNYPTPDGSDIRPRELVNEALAYASEDPEIDLTEFDKEDLYDVDGDGNYSEPDGIIDHLMLVHAGTGEEAGGGSVGADAIWSHSWSLSEPTVIPGTEGQAAVDYWDGGGIAAYDYTVQPEDGATGVFAHEYGHDLGLPDEYDTNYTKDGVGAPTDYWTLMASGSWAGEINGTEPTGFSPYDKEYLQNKYPGSNWFKAVEYSLEDIKSGSKTINLDQASVKGTNADAVKVTLPNKETVVNTPTSGQYEYFSGSGNDLNNSLTTTVDLTNATTAEFSFNANYDIEEDWDYAYVQVKDESGNWVAIPGTDSNNNVITRTTNPNGSNLGHGITGNSNGWINASFDLSEYVGQKIEVGINYVTDAAAVLPGLYADDLAILVDGEVVVADDVESDTSAFSKAGFTKSTGTVSSEHYYLIEWRNWAAADKALGNTTRGDGTVLTLDPGMVIWYVDNKYTENWVGDHPGDGFLGVVDAHQAAATWSDSGEAIFSTRYQIQDAAFSLNPTDELNLNFTATDGANMVLDAQPAVPTFNDYNDYSNPELVYAGRNVPKYGLSVEVVDQADDMSVGQIKLSFDDHQPNVSFTGLQDIYSSNEGTNTIDLTVTSDDEALDQEVTVTTNVINSDGVAVEGLSDVQTYRSDKTEKEIAVQLTLPEDLPSGNYTVEVAIAANGSTLATSTDVFRVDNDAPTPEVDNNGSVEIVKDPAVQVTIDDAKEGTLEYMWSTSQELVTQAAPAKGMKRSVTELDAWKPFNNGDTLTLNGVQGNYYLHVRGEDTLGNAIAWTSNSFTVDGVGPVIELAGENPTIVPVFTEYVEPGFTAVDGVDGDVADQVVVTGEVDTNTTGEYVLTYTVSDALGNESVVERRVHVVDETVPYIELTNGNTVEVEASSEFVEPGFTATDNVDGDLTESVVVTGEVDSTTPGEYTLTYTVTDSSNNEFSVTRTVSVVDTTAPALTLTGETTVVVEGATEYVEPGFTATDIVDGDVTETVKVSGNVDVNKVGNYVLTYTVVDAAGNEAVATRTVSVVDTTAPVIEILGESPVELELGDAYVDPGFVATDSVDGNISDYVVKSTDLRFAVGEYTVTYTVADASGNEATATRKVTVIDTAAPALDLEGEGTVAVDQGTDYVEPGFTATDNADGNLTDAVTVSGKVDTTTVGEYTLTYTVSDASGNVTTVKRIVTVNAVTSGSDQKGSDKGKDSDETTGPDKSTGSENTSGSNKTKTDSDVETAPDDEALPETATNTYNWLFTGLIVLVAGVVLIVLQRRRKGMTE